MVTAREEEGEDERGGGRGCGWRGGREMSEATRRGGQRWSVRGVRGEEDERLASAARVGGRVRG